jgi:hypothetical protein
MYRLSAQEALNGATEAGLKPELTIVKTLEEAENFLRSHTLKLRYVILGFCYNMSQQ